MKVRLWLPALVTLSLVSAAVLGRSPEQSEMAAMVATLDAHPDKVIALCERFRSNPFAPGAANLGGMLTAYALAAERVHIEIDDHVIAPMVAGEKADDIERRLLMLYMNGLLTHALSNKGAPDDVAANVRALREVVTGYAQMQRSRPQTRNTFAEELTRVAGTARGLEEYVYRARASASPGQG